MKTADCFFRSDDYIPPGGTLVGQCRQTLSCKLKGQHSKSKKTVFLWKQKLTVPSVLKLRLSQGVTSQHQLLRMFWNLRQCASETHVKGTYLMKLIIIMKYVLKVGTNKK